MKTFEFSRFTFTTLYGVNLILEEILFFYTFYGLKISLEKLFIKCLINVKSNYSARRGHRSSRRNPSITKPETVKTWSQTMRALVKNGFTKAATLSRRTGREVLGMTRIKSPINIPAAGASSTSESIEESKKSSARRLPSVETEASGTGSSQTWEDCGKFS